MGTEIQDFAAELRRLKERSGLSYGALARKLHMSTSTVHRYCNGDAVPADYAPVERLARVCRANPDESVALHRRWILADEAKRRGARRPEAGRGAVPGAVAPDEGRFRGDGEDAAGTADPEPVAPSGGAADPGTRPDDGHGEPEPDDHPETEPVAADVTSQASGVRAAAGRGRTRRMRVLLAATAVVALTVPTALALHGFTRGDAADDVEAKPSLSAPATTPGAGGGLRASASAEPSRSESSPAAAGSRTAKASPTRAGTDGKEGEEEASGVPVHATISSYNWEEPCGQFYLLDREPDDVPPPPAPQDTRGWARALDGVDGGAMKLALTVQGASRDAVVLTGLNVRVLARDPALDRSAYSMGTGCGSGITPQSFDVDLDDARPRTEPVAGTQGDEVVPAKDFPYRVSSTDVEVFHLDAHVEGHDVSWYLELSWSSGGRTGTLRVDDHGRPFRTSSITARPEYLYRPDIAQWELTQL
ncbi:helix-turn-helix domain-containing protein [Streptomyces sp. NBC_01341]|uniref:transcriptional regulator n=1 Tax=Streptomyces sp. NBC_01341 TaxID=2903831 RepID=UPI002E118951|nr:helix-turn-helix domain-containing protein [Streptomyces sp. NBC_01341]